MPGAAGAWRAVIQLARFGLGQLHQIFQRLHTQRWVNRDHIVDLGQTNDRYKIGHGVVGQLRIQREVGDQR